MSKSKSSSSGDRIDFGGKVPQFELFADKVYVELSRKNLAWIKVGDPEAGNADDIQYATRTEIHAFQVKWSQQVRKPSFSYSDFISLFLDLRNSWLRLINANAESELSVYVHLLTNRPPALHDKLVVGISNTKTLGSFSDFLEHAWPLIQSGKKLHGDWNKFLQQELKKLELREDEFIEFAKHLHVEVNATLPQPLDHRHQDIYQQDVTNLYKFFHDELAQLVGQVKYTADELIQKMQWEGRRKAIFSHDFFIDPKIYQPNTSTLGTLSHAVDSLAGGYIFLQGGPGSGKSSLLTQWANSRMEKVVKYFAFVNQVNGNQPIRGEAVNLFHDLTIQLTESGFLGSSVFGVQRDLTQTQQVFQNQLQQLGKLYQDQGTKTIIIIDGLDHIPREYAKQGTLLEHLPHPNDIPKGIYVILGSQSFDLTNLTISVKQVAEQPNRKIGVEPLLPVAVSQIAENVLGTTLTTKEHHLLFQTSKGHPLFLQYVLRSLQNQEDFEPLEDRLVRIAPFDEDISQYYGRMWQEFETDEDIADLLGLVCRLRFGFHKDMRDEWKISLAVARKAKRWFNQFFDESFGFKVFFHNSFRQFLLHKTAEDPFNGKYDHAIHIAYHRRLADWSGTSKIRLFRHEHLHHIFQAGQFGRFHDTLTHYYVDQQRHSFRPLESIIEDINIGLQLTVQTQDAERMLRYGFLIGELYRRAGNMDQNNFLDYFPILFDFESITEYALLAINSSERRKRAFKIARLLYENDFHADARRLFILAEPIDYAQDELTIDDENGLNWHEDIGTLEEWVKTKCLWCDTEELLEKILNVNVLKGSNNNEFLEKERSKKEQELQTRLLDALIDSLGQMPNQRPKLVKIFRRFDYSLMGNVGFFLPRLRNLTKLCFQDNDFDLGNSLLDTFLEKLTPADLAFEQRIEIAHMLYDGNKHSHLYQDWISDVILKPLTQIPFDPFTDGKIDYYSSYFKYIVLRTVQYKSVDLSVLFPHVTTERDYDPIVTEWFKMLARIARIQGEGLRGDSLNIRNLLPILRFYYRPKPHLSDFGQTRVDMSRKFYFEQVIDAVAIHGIKVLTDAAILFESEFRKYRPYWPAELQLAIWQGFRRHGLGKDKTKQLITETAGAVMDEQGDLGSRMNKALELSAEYLVLDGYELAHQWLRRAADESFSIGYSNDYQLNDWIAWMEKANEETPEQARGRIRWLAGYLDHIDRTTDGGAASSRTAYGLLQSCMQWNPAAGLEMFDWLLKRKYVHIDDGIELLLDKLLKEKVSLALLACSVDLFGKVLLFSSRTVSSELFSNIIHLLQQQQQVDLLTELGEDVERYALQEKRAEYHDLFRDAKVPFSPSKGFQVDKSERNSKGTPTVRLTNDSRINFAEFVLLYTTATELQNLLSQVIETSGKFNWQACLQKVNHGISEPWFTQTLSRLKGERRSSFFLILALGELAHKKGYDQIAEAISTDLLGFKDTSWSPYYDGGTKLRAYEFAIKVEGETARQRAWIDFIGQFERRSSAELLRELDEIIPVLAPGADAILVWTEIEAYLIRMLSHAPASLDVPDLLADSTKRNPEALIARLALNLSKIAERGLRETALIHLSKQTANGNVAYTEELRDFVNDNIEDIDREIFVKIALYLDYTASEALNDFQRELKKVSNSSLLSSKIFANSILQQYGLSIHPETPPIHTVLPWLNNPGSLLSEDLVLFDETISKGWTGNRFSIEHLGILTSKDLDKIAKITGIAKDILFRRIVNLFIADLQQGSGRLKLLAQGGEIGLESTYNAYAVIIPFLIDRLLNELWLGGYLPMLKDVSELCRIFDPHTFHFVHHRRPEQLSGVRGFDEYYTLPSDWVEDIEDGFSHFIKHLDDKNVIAERTIFRGLSWNLATEIRESCLTINEQIGSRSFATGAFRRTSNMTVADYTEKSRTPHQYTTSSNTGPLIMSNHAERTFDTPTHLSDWIAINPKFARSLGWQLADPSKFQWVDSDGNIMVESFFWVDGNTRMSPPNLRSQSGSGWLITASQEAFSILNTQFKLIRKQYIDRQSYDTSSREQVHRNLKQIEFVTP